MPRKKRKNANHEGSIYRRKDGRFVAAIKVRGKRRSAYAPTKEDAEKKLEHLRKQAKAPIVGKAPKTLTECVHGHIRRLAVDETTKTWKQDAYDLHCAPQLGHRHIEDLKPEDIVEWVSDCQAAGVGARILQVAFDVLRSALQEAVKPLRLIEENPADDIPRPKAEPAECDPFTPEEAAIILNAKRGHRNELVYVLAFVCGLRQGEIFGLQKIDYDRGNGEVQIRRQVVEHKGKRIIREKPKTKSGFRRIPLPAYVVELIEKRLVALEAEGLGDCEWLCPTEQGNPWLRSTWSWRHWRSLLKKLKLRHRGFHHARHTAASMMLQARESIHVVSRVIGHSKASTTLDIYAHCMPGERTEALAAIAGKITPVAVALLSPPKEAKENDEQKTKSG